MECLLVITVGDELKKIVGMSKLKNIFSKSIF